MTDRVSHLVVALEKDIRTDDVEAIVNAIKMVRCVADVQMGIADPSEFTTRVRMHMEFQEKLYELIKSLR